MTILRYYNVTEEVKPLLNLEFNKVYVFVPEWVQRDGMYLEFLKKRRSDFPIGYELVVIDGGDDKIKYNEVREAAKGEKHKNLMFYNDIMVRIAPYRGEEYCLAMGHLFWDSAFSFHRGIAHFSQRLEKVKQCKYDYYNLSVDCKEDDFVMADWLRNSLTKIRGRQHILYNESARGVEYIAIERNSTNPKDMNCAGRSRVYCRYQVSLGLEGSREEIHFQTAVAECFYMMLVIASSAYEANEGGFPRACNMVFAQKSQRVTQWIRETLGMLYLKGDVETMMERLEDEDAVNQGMSKARKKLKGIGAEGVSYIRKSRNESFYLLGDVVKIELPEELRAQGVKLREIIEV